MKKVNHFMQNQKIILIILWMFLFFDFAFCKKESKSVAKKVKETVTIKTKEVAKKPVESYLKKTLGSTEEKADSAKAEEESFFSKLMFWKKKPKEEKISKTKTIEIEEMPAKETMGEKKAREVQAMELGMRDVLVEGPEGGLKRQAPEITDEMKDSLESLKTLYKKKKLEGASKKFTVETLTEPAAVKITEEEIKVEPGGKVVDTQRSQLIEAAEKVNLATQRLKDIARKLRGEEGLTAQEKELADRYGVVDKEIEDSMKSEKNASGELSKMFTELLDEGERVTLKELFEGEEYKKLEEAHKQSNEELKKLVIGKPVGEMEFDETAMNWAKGLTLKEAIEELNKVDEFSETKQQNIRKLLNEEISIKMKREKELDKTKSLEGVVKELEKLNKKPVKTFNDWEEIRKLRVNAEDEIKKIDENATKEAEKKAKERMELIANARLQRQNEFIEVLRDKGISDQDIKTYSDAGKELQKQNERLNEARANVKSLSEERDKLKKTVDNVRSELVSYKERINELGDVESDSAKELIDKIEKQLVKDDARLYRIEKELENAKDAEDLIVKDQKKANDEYVKQEDSLKEALPEELKEGNIQDSLPVIEKAKEKRFKNLIKNNKKKIIAASVIGGLASGGLVLGGVGIGIGLSGGTESSGVGEADFGVAEIVPYNFGDYDFDSFYTEFRG